MKLRFVSSNSHKIREASEILTPKGIAVVPASIKIEELQTEDVSRLVTDKLIKGFKSIFRPLFVEHTGLYIDPPKWPSRRTDADLLGQT
jgi:XTP/dITP diphosphohydrolase